MQKQQIQFVDSKRLHFGMAIVPYRLLLKMSSIGLDWNLKRLANVFTFYWHVDKNQQQIWLVFPDEVY